MSDSLLTPSFGKHGRSPRWRPPLTIARLTQATAPETATATTSASVSPPVVSIACWCAHGRERRDAVPCGGLEGPGLGPSTRAFRRSSTMSRVRPREGGGAARCPSRNPRDWRPTQSRRAAADLAEQARAVAVREDGFSRVLRPKTFCMIWIASRTAVPLGWGEEAGLAVDAAAIVGGRGNASGPSLR